VRDEAKRAQSRHPHAEVPALRRPRSMRHALSPKSVSFNVTKKFEHAWFAIEGIEKGVVKMDAFEQLVGELLWMDGYWVKNSVKVNLTKDEKKTIGRPSAPRWELDLVAYKGSTNSLCVIECKSYLDSTGVQTSALLDASHGGADRYKLFHDEKLRDTVLARLAQQFVEQGACAEKPSTVLGLAYGKIAKSSERETLTAHFKNKGWLLFDEVWLRSKITELSKGSYENQMSSVAAKLLLR
jgi:hypothetical protein